MQSVFSNASSLCLQFLNSLEILSQQMLFSYFNYAGTDEDRDRYSLKTDGIAGLFFTNQNCRYRMRFISAR